MDLDESLGLGSPDLRLRRGSRQEENSMSLIERLREYRESLGLSQAEVARRMGRHQSVVSHVERLTADPRWSSVVRYAGAMGVLIEYRPTALVDGAEVPIPEATCVGPGPGTGRRSSR